MINYVVKAVYAYNYMQMENSGNTSNTSATCNMSISSQKRLVLLRWSALQIFGVLLITALVYVVS